MRGSVWWVVSCTVTLALGASAHPTLNMGDLEQLAKKQHFEEVLLRATEVAPRERNARWDAIVAQSGRMILLDDTQRDPLSAYDKALDRQRTFPHLRRDTDYRAAFEEMVLESIDDCFARVNVTQRNNTPPATLRAQDCLRRGERLRRSPKTSARALSRSSERLWRGGDRHGAVASMDAAFSRADRDMKAKLCLRDQTQSVVDFGFAQPVGDDAAKAAKHIAFTQCGEIFTEELQNELARNPSINVFKNACPTLLKQKSLSGLLKKRCKSKLK